MFGLLNLYTLNGRYTLGVPKQIFRCAGFFFPVAMHPTTSVHIRSVVSLVYVAVVFCCLIVGFPFRFVCPSTVREDSVPRRAL